MVLYADQIWYDEVFTFIAKTEPIEIFFNERLYDLFIGLQYKYVSPTGDQNYKVRIKYNKMNSIDKRIVVGPDPATGTETVSRKLIQMYQEVSSIALWNPVASIIFASSLLPIVPTQTSLPKNWA